MTFTEKDKEPEDAHLWTDSLAPEANKPVNVCPQQAAQKEEIDFNALRNLLFSIRDNQVYCPLCRCPEWSSQFPDMRTSHYEQCTLGIVCEQLLRLYPKEGASIKWRK